MRLLAALLVSYAPSSYAASCDPNATILSAYDALLAGDLDRAEDVLGEAERALGCSSGIIDPESLGRFWLIEGALLVKIGDPDAALSFTAARRVAPDLWLAALDAQSRALWEGSAPEPGTGRLALDIVLEKRTTAVDGHPGALEGLPAGLHAVQIVEPDGAVSFGAIVYIGAGTAATLTTALPPELAQTPPPPEQEPSPLSVKPEAGLSVGASLAMGRRLAVLAAQGELTEPAAKFVVPLSLSGALRLSPVWVRLEGGAGLLLGGTYLGLLADRSVYRSSLRFDAGLAGGASMGVLDLGISTAVQWPGRLAQRAVLSYRGLTLPSGDLLHIEARPGFNIATDRPIEPAMELMVGYLLR